MKLMRLVVLCSLVVAARLVPAETPAAKPADAPAPSGTNAPAVHRELISLTRKMDKIIIPEIEFRQANIHDIVAFLILAARENDTTGDPEKGANIILNIGKKEVPEITFTARNVSLLQTLKIVTRVARLSYKVEGNVVMIEPE